MFIVKLSSVLAMKNDKIGDNESFKLGDIVHFCTPYKGADPNMIFIVLDTFDDGETSYVEAVKFSSELNNYFVIKKLPARDLERLPYVSPELKAEIEKFMLQRPGNSLVSRLLMNQ